MPEIPNIDWESNLSCIVLVAGLGQLKIVVHRNVLLRACYFYDETKNHSDRELLVEDVSAGTLRQIVELMYTREITITTRNVARIAEAALRMDYRQLVGACESFYLQSLTTTNCWSHYVIADKYCFERLRKQVLTVVFKMILHQLEDMHQSHKVTNVAIKAHNFVVCLCNLVENQMETIRDLSALRRFLKHIKLDALTNHTLVHVIEPTFQKLNCADSVIQEYRKRLCPLPSQRNAMDMLRRERSKNSGIQIFE